MTLLAQAQAELSLCSGFALTFAHPNYHFWQLRRSMLNCFNPSRMGTELVLYIKIAKMGPIFENKQLPYLLYFLCYLPDRVTTKKGPRVKPQQQKGPIRMDPRDRTRVSRPYHRPSIITRASRYTAPVVWCFASGCTNLHVVLGGGSNSASNRMAWLYEAIWALKIGISVLSPEPQ